MATDALQRSPSPTPAPPTASAPGPRASALHQLFSDAIAHLIKACSYAHFAACFPTPAREVPGSMKALHEQFNDKLGEQLLVNFGELVRDREAVAALNGLDRLVEEARERRKKAEAGKDKEKGERLVSPHTLPPQTLYRSHLAPRLKVYSQDMKAEQKAVQDENVELLGRVQQQRKDIAALLAGLETVVANLDASVASLGRDELDVLRAETRDIDQAMMEA